MTSTPSRSAAAAILLLSLIAPLFASAADDGTDIHWKKIKLSDQFMNEGATFGDFNHDGKADLISGPYWYEGPDFSVEKRHEIMPVQTYKTDNDYSKNFFAFAYDFNGDGWDDVLIIGFPGEDASWFENPKGKEGHWTRHKVFDHVDDESPTFADFLKTGKPVLLCATGGRMGYATPDWSDTTKPWTFHPISGDEGFQRFTHGLGFGDVNGDGRNDFLIAKGWYEQPASLDGDPAAVWKFHPANFGPGGAQMYVYDVNNDGRPDVISSLNAHGYGLAWFEQMPDGNFRRHLILSDQPQQKSPQGVQFSELHAVDLIDVNGDGLPDIITGKRYFAHGSHGPDALGPAVLYWFELKRDGSDVKWISHEIDTDSGVGTQVVAKRIDGGKIPSIAVGNKKGTFVFIPAETK